MIRLYHHTLKALEDVAMRLHQMKVETQLHTDNSALHEHWLMVDTADKGVIAAMVQIPCARVEVT